MIARFHYVDKTLQRFLHDEIGAEQHEMNEHIETCEHCQGRMETLTQAGMTWEEAGELLRDDLLDEQTE